MAKETGANASLTVAVEDGQLLIRIGVNTLAHSATYAEFANPWDLEKHQYIRTFAIANASGFAADVCRALLDEREDGSTLLTELLDKAMEAAVDDGSEHCEYDQSIEPGEVATCETWSTELPT